MKKYYVLALLFCGTIAVMQSCKKDKGDTNNDPASTDSDLFNAIYATGYTYYAGTPTITAAAGNSPHGFERVRFNSIAQAALDSTGKLPVGASFPAGSVIVKEVYSSSTGGHFAWAAMKKDPANSNSGSGYLWAEFNADGTTAYSTSNKGSGCISCHSEPANRDLVRIFDLR